MKKYFFTGLVIALPIALTLMVILFLFDFFTTPFVPLVAKMLDAIQTSLHIAIPEGLHRFIARLLALIFLSLFILLLGLVARWFVVRFILQGAY